MTTVSDFFDEVEFHRVGDELIQNGRYVIDGKSYTRCTNFIDVIDDTYGLMAWKQHKTAQGIAQSGALRAELLTSLDDWKTMERICEDAIKVAGGTEKRDLGSGVHRLTELADEGRCPDLAGDPVLAHAVAEYRRLMAAHELEIVESEQVVVCDALGVAGRFDRLVNWDGKLVVLDLKTGKLKPGSFARQFAVYAHAERIYDHATKEFRPMPPVDQTVALAVMLPVDATSPGELVALNIEAGWDDALLCGQVIARGHRKRLKEFCSWPSPVHLHWEAAPQRTTAEFRAWLIDRLTGFDAGQRRQVAERWPLGVPTFKASDTHTDDQLRAILRAIDDVDPSLTPAPAALTEGLTPVLEQHDTPAVRKLDEGPAADPAELGALKADLMALDPERRALAESWAAEANAAGRPISLSERKSQRRVGIVRAAYDLVRTFDDPDVMRTVVGLAVGDEVQPTVPLGAAIGALTPDEANTITRLCDATRAGTLSVDGDAVVGDALPDLLGAA